ncbi:MAG: Gfo/Idh/MocA family oxidoreductase [Ruminococcaceae bacterium]|nr:Gfo/Idh/MocA family oxidoreductase [Oscillospiraceae bacterium]
MLTFAVLGFGARGKNYTGLIKMLQENSVLAVCDPDTARLAIAKAHHNIPDEMLFTDEDVFFGKGRLADVCIVSTQDAQHHDHAIKALNAGYDLLLEKPIATSEADVLDIYYTAKRLDKKIYVCHVLRYAPFFTYIKQEIDSGKYGRVSTINLTEHVCYWHQAHSYVRGNWANTKKSSPMIVAKCCHDIDILIWLMGDKIKTVSSQGSLRLFKKENQPDGAADRCMQCKFKDTCQYSAYKFYIQKRFEKEQKLRWPLDVLTNEITRENLVKALEEGPYGRCVYACDNDAVDHQVTNFLFENGSTAHLTMTAFSDIGRRDIYVHCEFGEISGNMTENKLHCRRFGEEETVIDVGALAKETSGYGHGGGDFFLIKDIIAESAGEQTLGLTSIENSVESHLVGFAAEKSRLAEGEMQRIQY